VFVYTESTQEPPVPVLTFVKFVIPGLESIFLSLGGIELIMSNISVGETLVKKSGALKK
jgi:hypothetical protein